MRPQVSVIVPLHNKGSYVAETIESVMGQSLGDWEMIVVENHSTDGGAAIVREYEARDKRVRLIVAPPEVRGPGAARNLGLSQARGEWIQFLDADDLLLPGHFESQLRALQASPDADIITCDWLEGPTLDEGACQRKSPTNSRRGRGWEASAIAFTPWIVHSAWVRRSSLGESSWWDTNFDGLIAEDFPFWFRLLQDRKTSYSHYVGVFYRVDTTDRRNSESDMPRYLDALDKGVEANLQIMAASGGELNYLHRKALFNLHLGLLRFHFSRRQDSLQRRLQTRIRTLRPSFREAVARRDLAVVLSFILPWRVLRRLVEWRRGKR